MAFSLIWMPEVLRNAGLKVSLVDGWETRGRGNMGQVFGVMCHHTAVLNPQKLNMPTLRSLRDGRRASANLSALPGPLAQLGLGRDGTFFVVAAGKAIHAGPGGYKNVMGNSRFIGIEAENEGSLRDFPWPQVQIEAYHRGVAAILKHLGKDASFCCGHKEYAPGRKPDPNLNMTTFREAVAGYITGAVPPPPPIPDVEPQPPPSSPTPRPTLRRPVKSELVKVVQSKVGVSPDGTFGPKTEAAVRVFQRNHGLVPDGIVGPNTWRALDNA
jgi:peptidoglycan hydrolase-like protein with peptidoglycan-binding domain